MTPLCMAEARTAIAKFNEKNQAWRIFSIELAPSVCAREKRIREAQEGVSDEEAAWCACTGAVRMGE